MAKKTSAPSTGGTSYTSPKPEKSGTRKARPSETRRPSALVDTRVSYCGDNLKQLKKLPDACIDLSYIDPPFNSNRNYEVFWGSPREITPGAPTPRSLRRISRGETKEKRTFEDRHASTQAYIDFMRPRCVELARVLKKTGSFYVTTATGTPPTTSRSCATRFQEKIIFTAANNCNIARR